MTCWVERGSPIRERMMFVKAHRIRNVQNSPLDCRYMNLTLGGKRKAHFVMVSWVHHRGFEPSFGQPVSNLL